MLAVVTAAAHGTWQNYVTMTEMVEHNVNASELNLTIWSNALKDQRHIQLFWFICNLVVELPKRQLLLSLKQRPCEQNNVLCLCYDFFNECANVWSFLSSVFQLDKMIGAQVPKPACWFSFRWNVVKKISVMTETEITRSRTMTYGQRSFSVSGPSLWNSLPLSVRDPSLTMTQFCTIWRLFCFAEHTVLSIVPSWQFRL